MSLAGIRSSRGDEYQLQVALDWTIRLWTDPEVEAVHFESLGVQGDGLPPSVDDVVVQRRDGSVYIQAKKNHPANGVWGTRDAKLKPELLKARDQLERDTKGEVWFYSQSPFGRLAQLADEAAYYPDYDAFAVSAPGTSRSALGDLAAVLDRPLSQTYGLVRRVRFKLTPGYDDWDRRLLRELSTLFPRSEEVADFLMRRIAERQARLYEPAAPLTRPELESLLAERGYVVTPDRREADILAAFGRASQRGRMWKRDVDGERFERVEVAEILEALDEGVGTVAVTSGPGGGKTCVLLDAVDRIENMDGWAVLFLKGDQYEGARTEPDLVGYGLPNDVVGQAARLSEHRRVAVIVDALDVLSLQRSSGTLSLFLNLIDRLAGIEGVSVVAACRDFDLSYAPELRDRTWGRRVRVGLLSEDTVRSMLDRWDVDPSAVSANLLEIIRVPQHLRLYGQLVRSGVTDVGPGPYALHDRFLSEIVVDGVGLGEPAMDALVQAANRMQEQRRLTLPRSGFPGSLSVVEGLLSAEVLTETRPGVIAFSHQELLDCVAVRGAEQQGVTVHGFITARPALPFIRPTVRTFLFMARAADPTVFRRQVRAVLDDTDIAYHLRRLVAESLAEVVPQDEDWPLVVRLFHHHPDLFDRFLMRLSGPEWLSVIVERLIPESRVDHDAERRTATLLMSLARWAESEPEVVLEVWERALEEGWAGADTLVSTVVGALNKSLETVPDGVAPPAVAGRIIRLLLDRFVDQVDIYRLGPSVRMWVERTGEGDDLVWEFLQLDDKDGQTRRRRRFYNGASAHELTRSFLAARLSRSDELLDNVLGALEELARSNGAGYRRGLLDDTSWQHRHYTGMMGGGDDHEVAMGIGPVADAFVARASQDDPWWRANERRLQEHEDSGIRYLVLCAYTATPERNVRGIAAVLADRSSLRDSDLEEEMHELAHVAYPFLNEQQQTAHQEAALALYDPSEAEAWLRRARAHRTYDHLIWVPALFRTDDSQAFIDVWEREFDSARQGWSIRGGGGFVPPPFGHEDLLGLPDREVLRLVRHFGTDTRWELDGAGDPVGGWDQAVTVFRDAASRDPARMFEVLDLLLANDAPPPYPDAVVAGLGVHLRYRFGNLKSSSPWEPVQPLLDGEVVARRLLRVLELYGDGPLRPGESRTPLWSGARKAWLSEHTASEAVEGCSAVLTSDDDLARLALPIVRLARSESPKDQSDHNAEHESINSIRGEAAGSTVLIVGQLASEKRAYPDLYVPLLRSFAADPSPSVRLAVMRGLPYLAQYDDLAWELADLCLTDDSVAVWKAAERLLYYNYYRSFGRVKPYLDRLEYYGYMPVPKTYGRITTLAALAGHVSLEDLIARFPLAPADVSVGAARVLMTNLEGSRVRLACADALIRLVSMPDLPPAFLTAVARGLGEDTRPFVPRPVIDTLVQWEPPDDEWFSAQHLAEWVEEEAERRPQEALGVLEALSGRMERGGRRGLYSAQDHLTRALNAVLRDADESDDPDLIRRAVRVQDSFLRAGLYEVDAMLGAAERA